MATPAAHGSHIYGRRAELDPVKEWLNGRASVPATAQRQGSGGQDAVWVARIGTPGPCSIAARLNPGDHRRVQWAAAIAWWAQEFLIPSVLPWFHDPRSTYPRGRSIDSETDHGRAMRVQPGARSTHGRLMPPTGTTDPSPGQASHDLAQLRTNPRRLAWWVVYADALRERAIPH